jgi:hypothetical protein
VTSIERMRRMKLIGLVALLALPYCFWVGYDYSDRIEPWIGLIIFVGYLIFVNLVCSFCGSGCTKLLLAVRPDLSVHIS